MLALPLASVVTVVRPRNVCPSPNPEASHVVALATNSLEKNSTVKVVLGVLLRFPTIVVEPALEVTDVRAGKFCRLFEPVSASPGSLGIGPGIVQHRWMPRLTLPKILLPRIALPVPKSPPAPVLPTKIP